MQNCPLFPFSQWRKVDRKWFTPLIFQLLSEGICFSSLTAVRKLDDCAPSLEKSMKLLHLWKICLRFSQVSDFTYNNPAFDFFFFLNQITNILMHWSTFQSFCLWGMQFLFTFKPSENSEPFSFEYVDILLQLTSDLLIDFVQWNSRRYDLVSKLHFTLCSHLAKSKPKYKYFIMGVLITVNHHINYNTKVQLDLAAGFY